MNKPIYLDYNATTPLDPNVLKVMQPYMEEAFGNPSSASHAYGWEAKMAVDKAREQVAGLISADPKAVIFTSGATESNNSVFFGIVQNLLLQGKKPHIITSPVEHKAVIEVARQWESWGAELTVLPVNAFGQVSPADVEASLKPNTCLVSLMMANNEVGSINPIAEVGSLCRQKGVIFHTDAAQSFGKLDIDVNAMNIDMLSISGHKIYGPKGIGALYCRLDAPSELIPMFYGGEQEKRLRPGTLNVPGIVGLGEAAKIAQEKMKDENEKLRLWQQRLIAEITEQVDGAVLNGHPTERLANNISFSFKNLSADLFSLGLSGLALSSGSACTSGSGRPSHVLTALGHPEAMARATVRIGLGRFTEDSDIDLVIAKIIQMAEKNKAISIT